MPTKLKLSIKQKETLKDLKRTSKSELIRDRAQAVLTRNADFTLEDTARALQRSRGFVKTAITSFRAGKLEETKLTSHNRKLLAKDRKAIVQSIKTKTPQALGYTSQFWTMKIVKEWIAKKYHITYKDEKSYRKLFVEAGFTFQKPKPVDFRQDPEKSKKFKGALKKSYVNTKLRFSW
jgi:transposase